MINKFTILKYLCVVIIFIVLSARLGLSYTDWEFYIVATLIGLFGTFSKLEGVVK